MFSVGFFYLSKIIDVSEMFMYLRNYSNDLKSSFIGG